jgi:hypothetical protein
VCPAGELPTAGEDDAGGSGCSELAGLKHEAKIPHRDLWPYGKKILYIRLQRSGTAA